MYCLPICKEDPDEHIGNIFLSGGIEHGSKVNELLGLHLLYLLDIIILWYKLQLSNLRFTLVANLRLWHLIYPLIGRRFATTAR